MLTINKPEPTEQFCRNSILIVEDSPDHRFLIKQAVEKCMPGIHAVGAENLQEALTYLASDGQTPGRRFLNLILLDLYLPTREEGLSALKKFKDYLAEQYQPTLPVVMFSYSELKEDIEACYAQGANAYITKSNDQRDWIGFFDNIRGFWLETVSMPPRL
ncbi:response regulator [Persicitalea sp.]|uniref:response regulator n=1 Tax=Persicitalea sp. TaxID=3100273 RepID=UPI003593241C